MLKKILILLILLPVLGFAEPNQSSATLTSNASDEHVVFDKTPVQFVVPVGQQRMISFPDRVTITNTDARLTTDVVSILNNNGTLYITAKKAFSAILVPVKLIGSGQVVLVYLSSDSKAKDNNPLNVVVPQVSPPQYQAQNQDSGDKAEPTLTFNAVTLLRFASQQFSYKRLATLPDGVSRTPLFTTRTVDIYYGDAVTAYPLASWRASDLYVSVVQVINTTDQILTLDPRYIIGYWQAAAFYRFDTVMLNQTTVQTPFNVLTPQGTSRDYTLLLLVSNMPFGKALISGMPFNRSEAGL